MGHTLVALIRNVGPQTRVPVKWSNSLCDRLRCVARREEPCPSLIDPELAPLLLKCVRRRCHSASLGFTHDPFRVTNNEFYPHFRGELIGGPHDAGPTGVVVVSNQKTAGLQQFPINPGIMQDVLIFM